MQSKSEEILPKSIFDVLNYFQAGDLVLVGGRPGHGKTTFCSQLLFQAAEAGRQCFFFSLDNYSPKDVELKIPEFRGPLIYQDYSNEISSEYVIDKTKTTIGEKAIIVMDYLQLLDQRRTKPELQKQVEDLKEYAKQKKCIIIFISQVDKSFNEIEKLHPDESDVKLPNPLDLSLFNKMIFLHDRMMHFTKPKTFKIPFTF